MARDICQVRQINARTFLPAPFFRIWGDKTLPMVYSIALMHIITTTKDLENACQALASAEYLTVDTEFMRDSTYWPKLCLIQIAGPQDAFIIDPLSPDLELTAFYDLLRMETAVKVFHAARQDLEIFFHDGGVIPKPLFDTQVAAMACGFGDSVGYDNLVQNLTNVHIDKSSRFSDWSRRPLSKQLLEYAMGDVTHLRNVYEILHEQLRSTGREDWLSEEMGILSSPSTYNLDPRDAWKRLKLRNMKQSRLGILVEVAAWRETQAQSRNVPRQRVVRDDALSEIVSRRPNNSRDLEEMRGLPKGFSRSKAASSLLDAVQRGTNTPPENLPRIEKPAKIINKNSALLELLKVLLKLQCERFNVAQKLVASMADLAQIATQDNASVPALSGWRADVFGESALKLKRGEIAVSLKNQELVLVPVPPGGN